MKFGVHIDDKALSRQITKAMKVAPREAAKAMMDCVLDLAGESARRAPIESGDLRNNCHGEVQGATVFLNQQASPTAVAPTPRLEGVVGYSLPYALRQHEDLTLPHDRTDGYRRADGTTVNMVAGGEAKYLEKPFEERKPRYIDRFAKIVEESIK